MLEYWSDAFVPQYLTKFVPVEAFVDDHCSQAVEIFP
jgi:hypothetical protein